MSQIGNYDMSFPGLSVGGGSNSGSSSGSSSGSGTSQQSTQIVPGMLNVYSQLLGLNQQNYGNMKGAYQSQLSSNAQALPGIYSGYHSLQGNVLDTLGLDTNGQPNGSFGVAAPAAQQIQNTYQQGVASNTQQMAAAGLGNSTVGANLNAQAAQQAGLSLGQLGSSLAQTAAGYQSQIGQAGLGAQMQGQQMQTGLTQAALNPLDTQYANTAGTLTGGVGQSSYSNNSSQQSKNQGSQGQGGSSGATGQAPAGNVTGAPGGPAGDPTGAGPGGPGGGGPGGGVPGTNPYGAGGNNTSSSTGGGYDPNFSGPGTGKPGTQGFTGAGGNYTNVGVDKPSSGPGSGGPPVNPGSSKDGGSVSGAGGDPYGIASGKGAGAGSGSYGSNDAGSLQQQDPSLSSDQAQKLSGMGITDTDLGQYDGLSAAAQEALQKDPGAQFWKVDGDTAYFQKKDPQGGTTYTFPVKLGGSQS